MTELNFQKGDGLAFIKKEKMLSTYDESTFLQPAHQTEVPIRVSHGSWTDEPFVSIAENTKVPNLKHVFSARTVLPSKFTDMKIPVVNLDDRSQTIVQGTKLGTIEEAKELRDADEADSSSPN